MSNHVANGEMMAEIWMRRFLLSTVLGCALTVVGCDSSAQLDAEADAQADDAAAAAASDVEQDAP